MRTQDSKRLCDGRCGPPRRQARGVFRSGRARPGPGASAAVLQVSRQRRWQTGAGAALIVVGCSPRCSPRSALLPAPVVLVWRHGPAGGVGGGRALKRRDDSEQQAFGDFIHET